MKTSRARERIIAALLTARTAKEACGIANVSRSTLARWQKHPEFQAEYQAAKDAMLGSAINALRGNALLFTDTLRAIAIDEKQHGNARVRASEVGLTVLLKSVEIEDILRRLAALEVGAGGPETT